MDKNPYVRLRELCGASQKGFATTHDFWQDDDGVFGVWDVHPCFRQAEYCFGPGVF